VSAPIGELLVSTPKDSSAKTVWTEVECSYCSCLSRAEVDVSTYRRRWIALTDPPPLQTQACNFSCSLVRLDRSQLSHLGHHESHLELVFRLVRFSWQLRGPLHTLDRKTLVFAELLCGSLVTLGACLARISVCALPRHACPAQQTHAGLAPLLQHLAFLVRYKLPPYSRAWLVQNLLLQLRVQSVRPLDLRASL
jgi:hypothetical protein